MKIGKRTVSAIVAVALAGGGALMIDDAGERPREEPVPSVAEVPASASGSLGASLPGEPVTDDVMPSTVSVPVVSVPQVETPKVDVPVVEVPGVVSVTVVSAADMARYGIGTVSVDGESIRMSVVRHGDVSVVSVPSSEGISYCVVVPSVDFSGVRSFEKLERTVDIAPVSVPSGKAYEITLPDLRKVRVDDVSVASLISVIPELSGIVIENPGIAVSELIRRSVEVPGVTAERVMAATAVIPKVSDPADRIPLVQKFVAECKEMFRDQRGIAHDRSINFDNAAFRKWMELYRRNEPYALEHVPVRQSGLKMVAEVHHPIDTDVFMDNLEFYRSHGCNAALVTFGYHGESMERLLTVVEVIHSQGMQAYFAYSGRESFDTVFMDPDELRSKLRRLARVCDGFLLGWRRTSLHLFEQDPQYVNFVTRAVREANPRIPVIGEAYYGQTASSNESIRNLQYNVPANASGVAIVGLGYNGVAVELVVRKLLKGISGMNRMVLVTGDRPYYATRNDNGLGFAENYRIKERIAERWSRAGVRNAVILHGDGSDGNYGKGHTDNFGITPCR